MKRVLWGMILLSLVIAGSARVAWGADTGGGVPIQVSPARGGTHTRFVLRFSIPVATGATWGLRVSDDVTVTGPPAVGCVRHAERLLGTAPAHTAFEVTLDPSQPNGRWCTGRFNGVLVQRQVTLCPPGPVRDAIVCPLYVIAPRVLARFRFTVTRPRKTHSAR